MADTIMRGSVKMAADMKWDGVKFDSCSMFHNLTKWADLINQTNRPMLLENCHQGAYTPGIGQWQGYIKNTTSKAYYHFLGTFFGLGSATLVPKVTFAACKSHCDALQAECGGFTFKSLEAEPSTPVECYVEARPRQNHMDMSNTNYCTGSSDPSDCPYNLYRVSGDISASWGAMLAVLSVNICLLSRRGYEPVYGTAASVWVHGRGASPMMAYLPGQQLLSYRKSFYLHLINVLGGKLEPLR